MYVHISVVIVFVVADVAAAVGYFNNVLWFWQHLNNEFIKF